MSIVVSEVSVRAVWEHLLPPGTELLAGEGGLERGVTWSILLRAHPPAFDPPRGGEIAIVPLDRLRLLDAALSLTRVVSQLAPTRIAALLVVGEVPEDAVRVAEAAGLPLFGAPSSVNAADLHQALTRGLAEQRVRLADRVGEVSRELSALALGAHGQEAIVKRAGQLAQAIVGRADGAGRLTALYVPPGEVDRAKATRLVEHAMTAASGGAADPGAGSATVSRVHFQPDGTPLPLVALLTEVRGRDGPAGQLVLIGLDKQPGAVQAGILEQAAVACAIDVAREEAAIAARDELLGDFLDDLVRGGFPSAASVERRALALGYDLSQPHLALAAGPLDDADIATLNAAIGTAPGLIGPAALHSQGDDVVILGQLAGASAEVAGGRATASWLIERGVLGPRGSVGVGGIVTGAADLSRAIARARQALSIGRRRAGSERVTVFADLGVERLLFELRDAPSLLTYRDEMLAPLLEHDRRGGGELVRTLDAYLATGCSPSAAAGRLHMHRNGLLYRLARIRSLVPVDLDDPEQRLGLHLALRIGDLLEGCEPAR